MKIAIIGYSGSGKSTLAQKLGELYGLDILHLDAVQFLPNWKERPMEEQKQITKTFLDTNDSWVIDGNYSKLCYERRMEEADWIFLLLFNRFTCLYRVIRRYLKYKNTVRPDMPPGCEEKLDLEFIKWVLRDGRTKRAKKRYRGVIEAYPQKAVVVKNQRQLNAYLSAIPRPTGGSNEN